MINPILERELKTRMRSWKTAMLLFGYLTILGLVVAFAFFAESNSYRYGVSGFDPTIVTGIYVAISMFQLGLLLFILPIFTATSISGEKERQTFDLLMCTDISPWAIIFGKMSAALSFVFLLVFAAIPFTGVILLFGGVTIIDLIKIMLFYMATAFMVSSIGMFCTTHFKKNISSIVMSYVILGAIFFIPLVVMAVVAIIMSGQSFNQPFVDFLEKYAHEIMTIMFASNPFFGISSLLSNNSFGSGISYLFSGMGTTSSTFMRYITPWMACTIFYALFSSLLLFLTKRKLVKLK
jgi:ABC-type transport system involved in multi-copper enzyme maturation permease subunit